MKKIILIMALLLVAAPAMATVTISCASDNTGVVTVSYVATGNSVRAFAFDVNAVDALITTVTNLSTDYFVHPGSTRLQDPGATIQTAGFINCSPSFPGTLGGIYTDGVTTEQATLYEGANSPPSSGDLFSFVVNADCTVEIRENAIRTGVVMEDPDEDPVLTNAGGILTSCVVVISPTCWGDVGNSDSTYGHDGKVDWGDLIALVTELLTNGDANNNYLLAVQGEFAIADVGNSDSTYGQDGKIDWGDLIALVTELLTNGDANNNYLLPACFPVP